MKTETEALPRLGIVDALSAGLAQARRRPWLILIPALIDFWLWLGPRFSIQPLLERFLQAGQDLLRASGAGQPASVVQLMQQMNDATGQLAARINLAEGMAGGWLGAPSLLASDQISRMTFFSNLILAPFSALPETWRAAAPPWPVQTVSVGGFGAMLLWVIGFWLVGQIMLTAYLGAAGAAWLSRPGAGPTRKAGPTERHGFLWLFVRLAAFNLLLAVVIVILAVPLVFAVLLLQVAGNAALGVLAVIFSGVVLWLIVWFLLALFFAAEAALLERQPLGRSLTASVAIVHRHFGAALGLVALVNLLVYGFRVIWGLLMVHPVGMVVSIFGNAYLATGMLLAMFAFYESLRRAAVTERAKHVTG